VWGAEWNGARKQVRRCEACERVGSGGNGSRESGAGKPVALGVTEPPSDAMARIPCPFVYADGRRCGGHIVRIEAFRADLLWAVDGNGRWRFDFRPRSHYHLSCSEKGNHAGFRRQDPRAMKFWYDHLPEEVRRVIEGTDVAEA
jgi:hypothetical protein